MNKIVSLHTCHDGLKGAFKSPAILVTTEPNILEPLIYLRKPSNLTEEQFKAVVKDVFSQIQSLSSDTITMLETPHETS